MLDFTPEQLRRWDAWQSANAITMRQNDRLARIFGIAMLSTTLAAVAIAIWR